ncbi:MAG TPA: DUF5996 family protein [Gammaproteobacteria bacterium]
MTRETYDGRSKSAWPELPGFDAWRESCTTLHMWTQVVGKIRLELSPWINHSWGSALYVTTRGLSTSPIPYDSATFNIEFDFVNHALHITASSGEAHSFRLEPMPVAEFYRKTMQALHSLGIKVKIFTRPVEVEEAIPFEEDDRHADYDAGNTNRFWQALVQADRVFKAFRARFRGKVSPVHFFWGAFDLAVTRFSGRTAPLHPGGAPNCPNWVMQEAYSHEVASAGFWPGAGLGEAAFYAYAYPEPEGYRTRPIRPDAAYYSDTLHEFILPYEAVRTAAIPAQTLLEFLESSYASAADFADWDRPALEIDYVAQK